MSENIRENIATKVVSLETQRKENEVKNNEFQKIKNEILSKIHSLSEEETVNKFEIIIELFKQLKKAIEEKIDNYIEISILTTISQRVDILKESINLLQKYMRFIDEFTRLGEVSEDMKIKKLVKNEYNFHVEIDCDYDEVIVLRDRKYEEIGTEIFFLTQMIDNFYNIKKNFNNTLPVFLSEAVDVVNDELSKYRQLRNIADNALTEDIYNKAVDKCRKLEKKYRKYFYRSLPIVISIAISMFLGKSFLVKNFEIDNISYWVLKISIILIGVTIISYFLKQSIHYQRLADQNYQTQVELQAYPSFMKSIPTEEAASVRKELALKYFGREIDGTAHKDMSNLISDQMKSTTDMVKATTEAIKSLNGSPK